jgi:hypothetical protein
VTAFQWASVPTPLTAGMAWNRAQTGAWNPAEAPVQISTSALPAPGFSCHPYWASPVPVTESMLTVADVAPVRLWKSLALTRLQADPVAPPAAGTDEAVVGAEPVAVLVEPVAVLGEPVAVLEEPVAVLEEPVAVLVELVAVLEEPHAETIAMQARENAMPA